MTTSVGIDISTYTGMARTDGQNHMGKVVNFPKAKGWNRLQLLANEVKRTLSVWSPDIVVIEGLAYGNKHSLVILVECATVIKSVLHELGHGWWTIPPSGLKKWVTGSGSASKDLMATKVKERWGFESNSDDIVDAFALANLGQLGPEKLALISGAQYDQ